MRFLVALVVASCLALAGCFSCSVKQDPEALRRKTAETTAALKSDAKAVGQGIAQGLKGSQRVDLNHATAEELEKLPGITAAAANRIIRNRPYDDPRQLVTRRILPQAEYDQISDKVEVKK
jgi:DNA uptake protein ComE-like DNA-binding protein